MEQKPSEKVREINVDAVTYTAKPISKKSTLLYGLGPFSDQMSHQMFQFLIFTYYYAIVKIDVGILAISFVIFAVWDSINDPIVGTVTDRTNVKMGKRKFWTIVSLVPFALINIFLFTPPFFWTGNTNQWVNFTYMVLIILAYDTIYSFYDVSQLSLFSEMFITEEERGRGNLYKCILTILGVIIGFVVPTIFIDELAPDNETTAEVLAAIPQQYFITGIMVAVLVVITGFFFFKFGIIEDRHHKSEEPEEELRLRDMLKDTVGNGKFILFCIANLIKWTVFKLLTTIIPLWAVHNLGIDGIRVSVLLLGAFVAAMFMFPLMEKLGLKIGWRNGFIVTQIFWCFALIPFWWFNDKFILATVGMVFVGVGLSGAIYFVEPIIANIIDEDELRTGKAKAGSYYGINGLINRLSTILVFAIIAIVLTGYGWDQYVVGAEIAEINKLKDGLRLLLVPISIGGNIIVAILLYFFPLHGDALKKVQLDLNEARLRRV